MILRRDHIAGGAFIAAGVLLFALSGDLPFGTLASPGAGMLPKLVVGPDDRVRRLLLVVRAGESPPLATIDWSDFAHAATVVGVTAAAIALYTVLGFVLTMSLLMFVLLYRGRAARASVRAAAVQRRRDGRWPISCSNTLLKSPLPRDAASGF